MTVEEAIQAFQAYDWERELSAMVDESGDHNCPPGIGIHNGFDNPETLHPHLLHICPRDSQSVFLNMHYPLTKKILGVFSSTREHVHHVDQFPLKDVPTVIRLFFKGDVEHLIQVTRSTSPLGEPLA